MGNLNCSNLTLDNQTEINSADINHNNTLILKHNNLKISSPIRTMIKSKSCPPRDKLSLKEKNYIFSDKIKSIETKNDTKNFRRSFTPRRSKQFKISEDNKNKFDSESILHQKKIIKNKLKKDEQNQEKEEEEEEDNDKNKKGSILKKGKSSPLEVICEQIEDEKKVLDTTRTIKNKEIIQPSNSKNINDNNNSEQNNNISNNNDNKNENINIINNHNKNQNLNLNLINNSSNFSESSNNNINENNNKENSEIKKNEQLLYFNHTGSSRGEEEHANENIYYNNYNYYKNLNDNMENKEFNKNLYIKEQYKDLYKKKIFTNKYQKELNWRNINIDPILSKKNENDILLKGEFLVFNNILEINSSNKLKYSRYLTLTKHVINIFRSKEKYIYNENPLINISLFNISKCDLLNKSDIEMLKNLQNLLSKYSLYIKLTTVSGMVIVEPSKNSNKKYRLSNPFLKTNYNKPKSLNKFTKKPKDIELISQNFIKSQNNNNLINVKNGEINDNNSKKNQNKYGLYIIISSDDDILLLNLIAIINNLRK